MNTKLTLLLIIVLTLTVTACAPKADSNAFDSSSPAPATPTTSETIPPLPTAPDSKIDFVSNSDIRFLSAPFDLINATQIDIPLPGNPVWIAGIPHESGTAWAVTLEDGSLLAYSASSNGYTQVEITPEKLPPGAPQTIYSSNGQLFALLPPGTDASPYSTPIFVDSELQKIAYIATNGDLVIWQANQETRLPVNALPDAQILTDEKGKLLHLSNPTDRYAHAVLGDSLEASGITLIDTIPEPHILQTISIPETDVIEGIYPIWADMNDDGEREIIVTLSNPRDGARIIAYREDGRVLAEGPSIGTGFRWRHQLTVAPFGAGGENLLAVVRTPHIGGVVEFYRLNGNNLEIVNSIPGYSTHTIGSRNLFTAQAGDFDSDGQVELLIPDQRHARLGIVGIDGATIPMLNLDGNLVTNLASAISPISNEVALAGGLSSNQLRIWMP